MTTQELNFGYVSNSQAPQRQIRDFSKIKVGKKTLRDDVSIDVDYMLDLVGRKKPFSREQVNRAIANNDTQALRTISEYFFRTNGIYSRLCRYMAYLYKYDWFVSPIIFDKNISQKKILEGWYKSTTLLENSNLKRLFGNIALDVIKEGCYYGIINRQKATTCIQKLPSNYCRSRYELNGAPAVEFNIKYFVDCFSDIEYRLRVLKMFPKEIQQAYISFAHGKLPKDFKGDSEGWFLIDPENSVKFNLSNADYPLFISVIPDLMDLDDAQDLDKKKMAQQILKIIIQQMPLDKNGDIIFEVEEAAALHENAVQMLHDAIGVDVLTTFADVTVADLADKSNVSSVDQLDKVERTVYNEAGVSQMQFNSDAKAALEKSIANDASTMTDLLLQFQTYAEKLLAPFNKSPKRLMYKVKMLPTTIYNYTELSSIYKDQTMLGFSKLLPAVALGHSQSEIISTIFFENCVLNLNELFTPPQMSSTMSSKDNADSEKEVKEEEEQVEEIASQDKGGRPELAEDEKSDKTIQNEESGG